MKTKQYLKGKTVILTQSQVVHYAGSEVVTLEIAEELTRSGANVTIVTHVFGEPIADEFNKAGISVYTIGSPELDEYFKKTEIDYAWIQHSVIPSQMLSDKKLHHAKFIFHHMSPFSFMEHPFVASLERKIASLVLFNSEETKDALSNNINRTGDTMGVLGNPSPAAFAKVGQKAHSKSPKRILIVSNHIPTELTEAKRLLESRGIVVEAFGNDSNHAARVTPNDIKKADIVISIGKTVQYGIMANTPVYCYDHFGGPGYLSKKNYEKAKWYNFSGRGFEKKDARTIVRDLTENYSSAVEFTRVLHKVGTSEFNLSKRMQDIFTDLADNAQKDQVTIEEKTMAGKLDELVGEYARSQVNLFVAQHKIAATESLLGEKQENIDELESRISAIYASRSWHIAQKLRRAKNAVRRYRS